jgi:ABC-type nitrate/sulfonate/bicarbonate transport system substrate-binding protein
VPARDPEPLRLGVFSPAVPLRVAAALALPQRLGLDVAEVPVESSPAQFRALLDGSLDAALTSPDNVVAYRYPQGNPLGVTVDARILLAVDRGLGLALYGRPGLSGVESLRGADVGVDVAASGFAFVLYEILARAGLRRGRDYRVVELGATPRRLDALLAGDCAATMLGAGSDLRAEAAGCPRLAAVTDVCRPYLGTVLAATGPASERADGRLAALVTTLREVGDRLAGGGEPDLATATAAAALRVDAGPAARYVAGLRDPDTGLVRGGEPDIAAVANVVDLRRRHTDGPTGGVLGALRPPFADLIDRRFLDTGRADHA